MTLRKGSIILALTITTVLLIIAMLKSNTRPMKIISVNHVHTYLYTSDLETLSIPLLSSHDDTHLLLEDAIDKAYITNKEASEKIPITVTSIKKDGHRHYDGTLYHQYHIEIAPALKTDNLTTFIEDALLVITYDNYPALSIPVGSFSYSFYDTKSKHLSIETRINIPNHIGPYPTSMGLYFNVNNKTQDPIIITKISLLTKAVQPNLNELIELSKPTQDKEALSDLMPQNYNPLATPKTSPESIEITPKSESFFLLPFTYIDNLHLLHRYPLLIEYSYQNVSYTVVYDDFLFIKTDPFIVKHDTLHNEVAYDPYN